MKLPHRRQFLHLAAGAAALPMASWIARAQAYPSLPVRLIVPIAPGGASDKARVLINAQMSGFGAKRKSSARSEHYGLTQAVIRKHSRHLPMGITDPAMEAWYHPPLHE
jgi:hypothetical protein